MATALADWVELNLLLSKGRVSDAELEAAIREGNLDPDIDIPNMQSEISRRAEALEVRYPIVRRGYGYDSRSNWKTSIVYRFLLLVSANQFYKALVFGKGTAVDPARNFEHLVGIALKIYVNGETLRMGAPRDKPVPSNFPDAVLHLAQATNEDFTYGLLEYQDTGDDNLDVVAWRPHGDGRPSQLVVLAQCAIGTDWKGKRSELDLGVWQRHIGWHSVPAKAFAVPFVHEPGPTWRETATRGGIVLDRLRIVSLSPDETCPGSLLKTIAEWSDRREQSLSGLESPKTTKRRRRATKAKQVRAKR